MAKVHDKYVVELAEIIKGYGNDPDINDPFCLSEFYRFYEVPNVCVSAENFKKMRPLSDYTEEIEPESISEWKKEFREYVDSLDIARDDWKGIIEYIDELPSVQPETNCSEIPNSSDTISRQQAIDALRAMQTYKLFAGDDMLLINQAEAQTELMMLPSVQPERKTGRWIAITSWNNTYKCSVCGRLLANITDGKNNVAKNYPYCHCGADMRGEQE